jgi:hypothetical protein
LRVVTISRKEKVKDEQDQEQEDGLPEAEWGPPPSDKVTMRTYYKSIRCALLLLLAFARACSTRGSRGLDRLGHRSKPKNKRGKGGMRTHAADDYAWDDGDVHSTPRW